MRFSLLPTVVADAVTDVTGVYCKQHGIELLMLDFDNTIIPYTTNQASESVDQWLKDISAHVQLCVVSNSHKDRVQKFCDGYGIPCITHANKPSPNGIRCCMERFGKRAEQCALVGDQIFTDTLGANLAGVRSILVRSIHNHTIWLKLRHIAEKPFIYAARKRRI